MKKMGHKKSERRRVDGQRAVWTIIRRGVQILAAEPRLAPPLPSCGNILSEGYTSRRRAPNGLVVAGIKGGDFAKGRYAGLIC